MTSLITFFGKAAGWLTLLLIVVIVADVIAKSLFDLTAVWVIELESQLFAVAFLWGIPYAWQQNRHVRVDLFYEKFPAQERAKVDFIGSLIFLIPWCLLVFYTGFYFAREAWLTSEGSPNPGGLPSFFPIKAMIPFFALLLLLQAVLTARVDYRKWKKGAAKNEEV